jgi:hypothetical protein
MKASDAFPSRYLQTSVVKGKPIIATISHVVMETVGQGADQKRKPVLYLDGQKPMVLIHRRQRPRDFANWPRKRGGLPKKCFTLRRKGQDSTGRHDGLR